jgi:hypothetical protein
MASLGFTKEMAHVIRFVDANEFTIEVWLIDTRTPERRETKFIEYAFKRPAR